MTLREFIRNNRTEIDGFINRSLNHVPREASCSCPRSRTDHYHDDTRRLNDEDRYVWIINDAGLYAWARSEGVRP